MRKKGIFISYRNVKKDNKYQNYELVEELARNLKTQYKNYNVYTIPPENIPTGTLFSLYDVAKFLNTTIHILDECDKFYILDCDYYTEDRDFTSIWTEAEACIWSYYDRDMFLSKYKKKDKFFYRVQYINGELVVSNQDLIKLSKAQTRLLSFISLDFDTSSRRPGEPLWEGPYIKYKKDYPIIKL